MKGWIGPALAAPATLWLLAAFAAPLIVVVLLALQADSDPFAPLLAAPSTAQFRMIFDDGFYLSVVLKTLALAAGVCAVTTLLAYPLALWIVSMPPRWRPLAMSGVLVPLLINVVVRSLGIELLLAPDGLINAVLGLFGAPRASGLLYNYGAIAVGLVQVFLPFMVLALYDVLQAIPPRVLEAARSLGASRAAQFFSVELPMSLPGLKAGLTFVFLMASSTYVSARMLGGKKAFTTGMLVWQEVLENLNAQFAAALALIMTATAIAASVAIALWVRRATPWLRFKPARAMAMPAELMRVLDLILPPAAAALIGVAAVLLLLPLLLVLVQSFNDVPQATMAGFRAFTWRWYAQLFESGLYFDSFGISLELAAATAAVTVLLASMAAFALVRANFRGKGAFELFWMLPISLPQVAIGIGMLRLLQIFIAVPPFLGLLLVHVTVTLPFCIGLLRASVQQLEIAQEEAAGSLGAGPLAQLWHVILAGLAPGLAAAAIVAMLLSFEEVTITSFLTTARLTTLPVRIYAEASYSLEPTVYAISTLIIATTIVAMLLLGRLVRLDRVFAR
jgi:putative spermidine/putrescine transport system permease protein